MGLIHSVNVADLPVLLITGAAGALGRALVRKALTEGRDCIALDRDRRGLERFHDEMIADGLSAPALYPLDLAGAGMDDYQALAGVLEEQFGRLDGLIHAAADFKSLRPLEHQPVDEWMKIIQAGLTGPMLLTRSLLPLLRRTPGSCVVFIQDRQCADNPAYWGAYGVAQGGREAMVATLSAELGPRGPRIEAIDPGAFRSSLRAAATPAEDPFSWPPPEQAAERVWKLLETERHALS